MLSVISLFMTISAVLHAGLTLEGDSGEEVALWLLTSLCTSAKREVEIALQFYQVALLILTVLTLKHRYILKGCNRISYEYKNCTTDPYSGK